MKIQVTQNNIRNGQRLSSGSCPIALAFHKAAKEKFFVNWGEAVSMNLKGKRYKLPRTATLFISRYDRGQKVEPFAFIARRIP